MISISSVIFLITFLILIRLCEKKMGEMSDRYTKQSSTSVTPGISSMMLLSRWTHIVRIALVCGMWLCVGSISGRSQSLRFPGNGIAAVVQQYVITYDDLRGETMGQINSLLGKTNESPRAIQQKISELVKSALETLIENKLILLDFEDEGYNLPESIIEEQIENDISKIYNDKRSDWILTLLEKGRTIEMERKERRERIIVNWMRFRKTSEMQIVISPVLVNAYYDNHRNDFYQMEQIRYRTLTINKPRSQNEVEAARALIAEISRKLKTGANFPEMAAVYSEDTNKSKGGEHVGWEKRESLREDIQDAVFSLEAGQISEIIETPGSWQLYQVIERKEEGIRPLDEVRNEIESILETKEKTRLERQWIGRLKKKYHVLTQDSSSGANQGGGVSLLPFSLNTLYPELFQ